MASRRGGVLIPISTEFNSKGLEKAKKEFDQFGNQIGKSTGISKWSKGVGIALAAAGAAFTAFAADAVKAAIDEEASIARLSQTMSNLGFAMQDAGVEKFIDDMQYLVAFTDTDLRTAFASLIRGTKDVGAAEEALGTAADIATARQLNIADVANALSKGYLGNTAALSRLNIGVDKSIIKSGDMAAIMAEVNRVMGGSASNAAKTLAGRMAILANAAGEVKESFGQGIIEGFVGDVGKGKDALKDMTDQMRANQKTAETFGNAVGTLGQWIITGAGYVVKAVQAMAVQWVDFLEWGERASIDFEDKLNIISDSEADARRAALDLSYDQRHLAANTEIFGDAANTAAAATSTMATKADVAAASMQALNEEGIAVYNTTKDQASAMDRLSDALDRLNGKQKSARDSRIALGDAIREAAGLSNGEGTNGKKEAFMPQLNKAGGLALYSESGGQAATKLGGIQQAALDAYKSLYAKGDYDAADAALARGRQAIASQAKKWGMSNWSSYIPRVDTALAGGIRGADYNTRGANALAQDNYYVFNGDLNVNSLPEAAKVVQQAARLRGLNGGRNVQTGVLLGAGAP